MNNPASRSRSLSSSLAHSAQRDRRLVSLLALVVSGSLMGCSTSGPQDRSVASAQLGLNAADEDVVVSWTGVKQTMRGFGASSAWFGLYISEDDANWLFDPKVGIGLSMLRVQVELPADTNSDGTGPEDNLNPVANTKELDTAKQAKQRGAQVWATAWTPPPIWKTTNNRNGSGEGFDSNKLKPERYQDFANYLADFAKAFADEGIDLLAISPQNEPDYVASWEGAQWTPQEMVEFVGKYLGPTLQRRELTARVVAPDAAHWPNCKKYYDAILADKAANDYTPFIATHPYPEGDAPINFTEIQPQEKGKEFWETEASQENMSGDMPDPTMLSALTMLKLMHQHLTIANMNAWNWWALTIQSSQLTDDYRQNPAFIQRGERFKRGYAFGHFSKFVRPGFKRIEAQAKSLAADVYVSAFRDSSHVAIVAINDGAAAVQQQFWLDGGKLGEKVTPWVTTDAETESLTAKAPITVTDDGFSYSLPPKSVVTFANWDAATETPADQEIPLPALPKLAAPTGGSSNAGGSNGVGGSAVAAGGMSATSSSASGGSSTSSSASGGSSTSSSASGGSSTSSSTTDPSRGGSSTSSSSKGSTTQASESSSSSESSGGCSVQVAGRSAKSSPFAAFGLMGLLGIGLKRRRLAAASPNRKCSRQLAAATAR